MLFRSRELPVKDADDFGLGGVEDLFVVALVLLSSGESFRSVRLGVGKGERDGGTHHVVALEITVNDPVLPRRRRVLGVPVDEEVEPWDRTDRDSGSILDGSLC